MARITGQPVSGAAGERFAQFSEQKNSNPHPITWHEADEARQQMQIQLGTGKKHLFRSRPGTVTSLAVYIPRKPDILGDEVKRKVIHDLFDYRRAEKDGENPPFDLDSVRRKVGGDYIRFKYAPGRQVPGESGRSYRGTCWYETDDDEVYAFLMARKNKNSGAWRDIVVEHPKTSFEVNGQEFPATTAGWEAAQRAVMAAEDSPQEKQDDSL